MNKDIKEAYSKIILDDSSKEDIYEGLIHYKEKPKKRLRIIFPKLITVSVLILAFVFMTSQNNEHSMKQNMNIESTPPIEDSLLSSLPYQLSIEDMKSKGFYVDIYSIKTVYNENKLTHFLTNVENKIPSSLILAHFTDEGDPILTEIIYKDNFTIHYDTTRDDFGEKKITTYTFEKIGYYEDCIYAYNGTLDKTTFDSGKYLFIASVYE